MKLIKFSITNFRSIRKADNLQFSQSTILIGRNNEGKSNVLKALNIAMNILKIHREDKKYNRYRSRLGMPTRRREDIYDWERDFPISLQDNEDNSESIFRLGFELNTQEIEELEKLVETHLKTIIINNVLTLEIHLGKDRKPKIDAIQKGRSIKAISNNSNKIAAFIGDRISFTYIPAVRTDEEAVLVVQEMISEELSSLENNPEYQDALKKLKICKNLF